MPEQKPGISRSLIEQILSKRETKELWGAGFMPVLPATIQEFSLGGVLPAIIYMMRWGQRRGGGKFVEKFGNPMAEKTSDRVATVNQVSKKLIENSSFFVGFDSKVTLTILADMLLTFCLENRRHLMGRDEPVQRVFPTHYFSSWVDLPLDVANLRYIPEMIVSILAKQKEGAFLSPGINDIKDKAKGFFSIGADIKNNLLLSLFASGTYIQGHPDSLESDMFDESAVIGIDQIISIRLAKYLGEAPKKVRGNNPKILNQLPIAQRASQFFYEDLNVFMRSYHNVIPRQSLLPMIESSISLGLTNIYMSTLDCTLHWERENELPEKNAQQSWPLFVDCSLSLDHELRRISEECMDDFMRRLERMPVCMMCLKLLKLSAEGEGLKDIPQESPDSYKLIEYLGKIIKDEHTSSQDIKHDLKRKCNQLARELKEQEETTIITILENETIHPAWRFSEAIVALMGDSKQYAHFKKLLDSVLMMNEVNGLGRKRRADIRGKKNEERRSIVLTNTMIDFLVHRHLRKDKKGTGKKILSLAGFLETLKERYGFYINESPPGLSVPANVLQQNKVYLENRLRDLGLYIGVNDAESMKRLRPRYEELNSINEDI